MAKKKKMLPEEAMYAGLGVASMAKDYFESFLDFAIKEGKMLKKDKSKVEKDLKAKGKKEYDRMMTAYENAMAKALKAMDIPSRKEFDALKKKVEGKSTPAKRKPAKKTARRKK